MPRTIALFDVDGTLTVARKRVEPEMTAFIKELRKHGACSATFLLEAALAHAFALAASFGALLPNRAHRACHVAAPVNIGVVGGSDLVKIKEQLGDDGAHARVLPRHGPRLRASTHRVRAPRRAAAPRRRAPPNSAAAPVWDAAVFEQFDYVFSENGLVAHKGDALIKETVRASRGQGGELQGRVSPFFKGGARIQEKGHQESVPLQGGERIARLGVSLKGRVCGLQRGLHRKVCRQRAGRKDYEGRGSVQRATRTHTHVATEYQSGGR